MNKFFYTNSYNFVFLFYSVWFKRSIAVTTVLPINKKESKRINKTRKNDESQQTQNAYLSAFVCRFQFFSTWILFCCFLLFYRRDIKWWFPCSPNDKIHVENKRHFFEAIGMPPYINIQSSWLVYRLATKQPKRRESKL